MRDAARNKDRVKRAPCAYPILVELIVVAYRRGAPGARRTCNQHTRTHLNTHTFFSDRGQNGSALRSFSHAEIRTISGSRGLAVWCHVPRYRTPLRSGIRNRPPRGRFLLGSVISTVLQQPLSGEQRHAYYRRPSRVEQPASQY